MPRLGHVPETIRISFAIFKFYSTADSFLVLFGDLL
jgi:hypothetical protein